jgi:hypothetical protein
MYPRTWGGWSGPSISKDYPTDLKWVKTPIRMELFREYGYIDKDGKLNVYNRDQFTDRIARFKNHSVEIIMVRRQETLSHQQRKYYFSVVVPEVQNAIKESNGENYTKDEVDTFLRETFLFTEVRDEDTDTFKRVKRRLSNQETDVTTKEFAEFINNVVQWVAENLDYQIPFPNEIFNSNS